MNLPRLATPDGKYIANGSHQSNEGFYLMVFLGGRKGFAIMSYLQQSAIKRGLFVIVYCVLHCFLVVPSFAEGQEQYLLITNESLKDSFQLLVDHRCSQGMDGKLITVEEIDANDLFAGSDIQEKIRSFIQSCYNPNRTMYLVLGGNEVAMPVRYCDPSSDGNSLPTDLYYADMDGTQWDADGDGIYGESEEVGLTELTPELCFGRIPVSNPEEAQAYCSKVLRYDAIDPNQFVDSMLLLSGSGYDGCYEGPTRPLLYRDHDPVSMQEVAMTDVFLNIIQPYWQPGRLAKFFDTNTDWDVDRFGDFQQTWENVISTLSKDFHYIYYWQHSSSRLWTFPDEDSGSYIQPKDARLLTNSLPSIIFARGCGTGYYDVDKPNGSLSEALIRNPNGGPVVMFAHARSAGGSPYWDQIMRNVFQEYHPRIGEAYRACLAELAPLTTGQLYHHYIFLLLGDPALACHRQTNKTLQLFSPKGNEVIDAGSDLFVRWNAAGSFSPQETVSLEYSDDDGQSWYAIPEANGLLYNAGCFTWSQCTLPNGAQYRIRVISTHNPLLLSESAKSFTVANMGELSVESTPICKVRIDGTHSNQTDFTCSAILNSSFRLVAPENVEEFQFAGWMDANGVLLSDSNEFQFTFDHNMSTTAKYNYTGDIRTYYINDDISENGISHGNDDNDGLSTDTPMKSIQKLLDRYPEIGYEDVIYISDGRYYENLDVNSVHTGVTLQGAGMDRTIIDGGQTGSCLLADFGVICHLAYLGFENGKGSDHGGALQLGSGEVTCTIRNCRFEDNVAPAKGGAIYMATSPALFGLEVYGSVFIRNHGSNGGVMFAAKNARAKFHDCVFLENAADGSGAFRFVADSSVNFVDCVFEGNFSSRVGGAIDTFSTQKSTAIRCLFKNNEAIEGGGAICIGGSSSMMLDDCVFEHNSSSSAGAIQIIGDGFSQIRRSTFQGNSATIGGAIEMEGNSTSECDDCTFENNFANAGGAINLGSEQESTARRCLFKNNEAIGDGGAINVSNASSMMLDQCQFISNKSRRGGALVCNSQGDSYHAQLQLCNSIFEGNYASFKGGVLWCNGSSNTDIMIDNCTFNGNSASANGGVILDIGTNLSIKDCIVWGNGLPQLQLSPSALVSYSNIEGGYEGLQNISENPLFAQEGSMSDNGTHGDESDDFWLPGDYHLQSQAGRWDQLLSEWVNDSIHSPCIDAGDPNSLIGDELYPNGNRINMGAYGGTVEASKSR
jgi:predicted outer membrane repeat protein